MNKLLHFIGIVIKFILLNCKYFFLALKDKKNQGNIDFSCVKTVVFSHNLGGGTYTYEQRNYNTRNTLVIRLVSYRIDMIFKIEINGKTFFLFKKNMVSMISSIVPEKIIVSSFCSYKNIKFYMNLINSFRNSEKIYLVHDYHSVCPTVNFLNQKKYCNMNCNTCQYKKKIVIWHNMWQTFFSMVTKVIVFSQSSKEILEKYYNFRNNQLLIIPHSMDYCKFTPIENTTGKNVAIIGNCSNIIKGKYVIKDFVKYLNKSKKYKLFIIGKKPYTFLKNTQYVKCTGSYNLQDLPKIINENEISVVIFTSICPETFSYAISEFIMLGLKIISMNMGAQGEKLENYSNAIFINNLRPETIIKGIEECFI